MCDTKWCPLDWNATLMSLHFGSARSCELKEYCSYLYNREGLTPRPWSINFICHNQCGTEQEGAGLTLGGQMLTLQKAVYFNIQNVEKGKVCHYTYVRPIARWN